MASFSIRIQIYSCLSEVELYCYNLEKTIGDMRAELVRDHREADSKLKSLEKHLQEVHRPVQILRDKQELVVADAHKGTSHASASSSQQKEEKASALRNNSYVINISD